MALAECAHVLRTQYGVDESAILDSLITLVQREIGYEEYELDREGDGVACEASSRRPSSSVSQRAWSNWL